MGDWIWNQKREVYERITARGEKLALVWKQKNGQWGWTILDEGGQEETREEAQRAADAALAEAGDL